MTKKPHGLTGKPNVNKGKRMAPESATRSLRLPVTLWDALDALAHVEGVKRNALVVRVLAAHVDQRK